MAFDSLQIPENQKSIVKALVESHTQRASCNIDDVVQGKGRGLVAVLHGSPGTGKTLTAEGIAELLKCPLYMVSISLSLSYIFRLLILVLGVSRRTGDQSSRTRSRAEQNP